MAAHPTKTSILIQIDTPLAEKITEYAKLDGRTRMDLIREALRDYLDARLSRTIAEQYREGYGRYPQEEDAWATQAAIDMIEEEPW